MKYRVSRAKNQMSTKTYIRTDKCIESNIYSHMKYSVSRAKNQMSTKTYIRTDKCIESNIYKSYEVPCQQS